MIRTTIRSACLVCLAAISCAAEQELEVRGAAAFPAADIRRAISADMPVQLARRPGQPPDAWLRAVESAVVHGYQGVGYRDASAVVRSGRDGGPVLEVSEGARSRCGPIDLRLSDDAAAAVRAALTTPPADDVWDIDTWPAAKDVVWKAGSPVDWTSIDRIARKVGAALRREGLLAAAIEVAAGPPDPVATRLTVALAEPPVRVRLGQVRIEGLSGNDAERLRAWLGLPGDGIADERMRAGVAARIRDAGSFRDAVVVWEDGDSRGLGLDLGVMTASEVDQAMRREEARLAAPVRARGRADLVVSLRRIAGVALPWEDGRRDRDTLLAARSRLLGRFAGGADLVVDAQTASGPVRLVWSGGHGVAVSGPGGRMIILGDGWLVCSGPAAAWRAAVPALRLKVEDRFTPDDKATKPNDTDVNLSVSGVAPRPGVRLALDPGAFVAGLLRSGRDDQPTVVRDGESLELRYPNGAELRADPVAGMVASLPTERFGRIRIGLQDGIWGSQVAPVIAAARQPDGPPVGGVLAEAVAMVEAVWPGALGGHAGMLAPLLRSGALDALVEMCSRSGSDDDRFAISCGDGRMPDLVAGKIPLVMLAFELDAGLVDRLAESAWPRVLLRAAAYLFAGDPRASAAALRPIIGGRVGPVGCLAVSRAVRQAGQPLLAGIIAERGIAVCDASGLELEAEELSGLAPAILPVVATIATLQAGVAADPGRRAALADLARICTGPGLPADRLAAAARAAAGVGAVDWLRNQLSADPEPSPAQAGSGGF